MSSDTGRRRAIGGLFAGAAALTGQSGTFARKKKKKCTHCPQRACCNCTVDFQTATKCILLETPNDFLTLEAATDLCDAFCSGPDEKRFTVNGIIGGFANVCAANNACGVKKCPVKVKA